jgi:protein-L-isoaspartate(D-aspartate) O-methyltransferase
MFIQVKDKFKKEREEMVKTQILNRGITNENILKAFLEVPREEFVSDRYKELAYSDGPLPIGYGVTISQPYIVALMCQILDLDKESKVLDIGTGSGYQATILSHLCKKVVTIEVIEELYSIAKTRLSNLGYENIEAICGDGSKGYKKEAPYDGIIVAAATEKIPDSWKEQLKLGGRIVYPKTENGTQQLVEVVKTENGFEKSYHGHVRFVPLVQKEHNQ